MACIPPTLYPCFLGSSSPYQPSKTASILQQSIKQELSITIDKKALRCIYRHALKMKPNRTQDFQIKAAIQYSDTASSSPAQFYPVIIKTLKDGHVRIFIPLTDKLGEGRRCLVYKTIGIFFQNIVNEPLDIKIKECAKSIQKIVNEDDSIAAKRRSKAMQKLKKCSQITHAYAWKYELRNKKNIQILFMPSYMGAVNDFIALQTVEPSFKNREKNCIIVALNLAKAINYMHRLRYLHNDIKLENVFLRWRQIRNNEYLITKVVLGDFDLAISTEDSSVNLSHCGGTYPYLSPERFVGSHENQVNQLSQLLNIPQEQRVASAASDMWAIGCLLYCLLFYEYCPLSIAMIKLEELFILQDNDESKVSNKMIKQSILQAAKLILDMPGSLAKNVEPSNIELVIFSLLQPLPMARMTSEEFLDYMLKIADQYDLNV